MNFTNLTSSVQLICSLNVIIPSSVRVLWTYDNGIFIVTPPNEVITAGNTTTLLIVNPQPSDAGVYSCAFIGLNRRRFINLGQFCLQYT